MNKDSQKLIRLLLWVFRATSGKLPLGWVIAICAAVALVSLLFGPALLPGLPELGDRQPNLPKVESPNEELPVEEADSESPYSVLESIGNRRYRSEAGLVYGPGSFHGHRVDHIMAHASDEPDRAGQHGVFDPGDAQTVFDLIDEVYLQALTAHNTETEYDGRRTIYTVNLGRRVGYIGGQSGNRRNRPTAKHVKLIVEGERVITAFPYRS